MSSNVFVSDVYRLSSGVGEPIQRAGDLLQTADGALQRDQLLWDLAPHVSLIMVFGLVFYFPLNWFPMIRQTLRRASWKNSLCHLLQNAKYHTQPLYSWNISSYIFRFYAKLWCRLISQLHVKLQCRYFSLKEDQTAQADLPAVLRGHFSCECAAPSPVTLCLTTPTGPCGLRGRTSVSSYQERAVQGKRKPPRRSCSTTRSPAPPTIGWLPWESACSSLTLFWRCCVGWFFH